MIRIDLTEQRYQWTGSQGENHVGRMLLDEHGCFIRDAAGLRVMVLLDYDGGLFYVDEELLSVYPSEPIPEPINQGAGR